MQTQPKPAPPSVPEPSPMPGQPVFTISQRTVSGLDHEISALVKELEQLGLDVTARPRR